jgi:AMMECR1 domain-containing protein
LSARLYRLYFASAALYQAVIANTVAACSRDPRFEAVTSDELEGLEIEVSVLTHPQPIESAEQIRLGVDGIILHIGPETVGFSA